MLRCRGVSESLPVVLIPGLLASARLYAPQLAALWRAGRCMVANHTRDDSMAALARRILAEAPPRFALVGLSMGGYVAFEILRQAPERVARVALLDTAARADTPDASAARRTQMDLAAQRALRRGGRALFCAPGASEPPATMRRCASRCASWAPRSVSADILGSRPPTWTRIDSRPTLAGIRCPTLVLVGEGDELTPPERAQSRSLTASRGARLVVVPELRASLDARAPARGYATRCSHGCRAEVERA